MADTETDPARASAEHARQLETLDSLAQKFGTSLSNAFTKNVAAGRQLDGVLGSVGTSLARAASQAALAPVRSGIDSLVKGLFDAGTATETAGTALARGGVVAGGTVTPFAEGGVVAAPTYFPLGRGLGLMGEAGAEAVMPLSRGADGRLGVAASGGGARPMSVTVNIATPDAQSFRRSEAQVSATLARALARGQRAS